MADYFWAPSDRPALSAMTVTTLVGDGASGDTNTFVSASQTTAADFSSCTDYTASAALTVVCDLSVPSLVTAWAATLRMGWQFNCAPQNMQGNACARCALVVDSNVAYGASASFTLEYQNIQQAWQTLVTGPLATALIFETHHGSGLAITARYLRLIVVGAVVDRDANGNSNTVGLDISDFRVTSVPPCAPPAVPTLEALTQITHHQPLITLAGK